MRGFIYAVRETSTNTIIYVGSTQQRLLCMRKGDHTKPSVKSRPIHQYVSEHGGWDAFAFECLEEAEFETKGDMLKREQEFIVLHAPSQNHRRAHLTAEEKKETLRLKQQRFRENHPDYHNRYAEQRRMRDQRRMETQVVCPCGGRYTLQNKSNHFSRLKHKDYEVQTGTING
jgi:hypothetical protein